MRDPNPPIIAIPLTRLQVRLLRVHLQVMLKDMRESPDDPRWPSKEGLIEEVEAMLQALPPEEVLDQLRSGDRLLDTACLGIFPRDLGETVQ